MSNQDFMSYAAEKELTLISRDGLWKNVLIREPRPETVVVRKDVPDFEVHQWSGTQPWIVSAIRQAGIYWGRNPLQQVPYLLPEDLEKWLLKHNGRVRFLQKPDLHVGVLVSINGKHAVRRNILEATKVMKAYVENCVVETDSAVTEPLGSPGFPNLDKPIETLGDKAWRELMSAKRFDEAVQEREARLKLVARENAYEESRRGDILGGLNCIVPGNWRPSIGKEEGAICEVIRDVSHFGIGNAIPAKEQVVLRLFVRYGGKTPMASAELLAQERTLKLGVQYPSQPVIYPPDALQMLQRLVELPLVKALLPLFQE